MKRLALVLSLALAACAEPSSGTRPLGTFAVAWEGDPARVTVKASDGRELLRTAAPFADVRTTSVRWEMEFGTYKWTEDDEPWAAAATLADTSIAGGNELRLSARDAEGAEVMTVTFSPGAPGVLEVKATARGRNRTRFHFDCAKDDHFLGFGAQADAVDHRGHKVPMWVSEPGIGKTDRDDPDPADPLWFLTGTRHASSYPMPAFLSNRGFAFLADTTRMATFDLCQARADAWSVENWDGALVMRLFDGPAPAKAIERLTADAGRQPLPNDLAFGVWNDAIFGSKSVRDVADLLRSEGIPSSVIWTEDFRGGSVDAVTGSYRLEEEWDVDRALYPDVEDLSKELHAKGFRWLAYHNTFLTQGTRILAEARDRGVLVKKLDGAEYLFTGVKFVPSALVDLSSAAGEAFVIEKLRHLLALGFDGWMADFGEWLPPDAKVARGDAEADHNLYPTAYHWTVEKALAGADPALTLTFARSGTLGTARHQPVVWAGDQFTNFAADDGMPTVVTMGLNLGLAGISTYGHDIGGYQNGTLPPSTKELFFRWTSLGALSPVMRTHHGTKAKTNWWFGKDPETIEHFARWARFHASLWPYFRAAAKEAYDTGLPIMRQLALVTPDDPAAWTMKDQYFLGPSLLVAPVLVEGATSRSVHFPPGSWLPFFESDPIEGGRDATVEIPVTEAGVFVRPGTIVPLLPPLDSFAPADPPLKDLEDVKGERSLAVFGGASGAWTDLDGTTYTLTSTSAEPPSEIRNRGSPLPACSGTAAACAGIDLVRRVARARGNDLSSVEFAAGDTVVTKIETSGALKVKEIVYRW